MKTRETNMLGQRKIHKETWSYCASKSNDSSLISACMSPVSITLYTHCMLIGSKTPQLCSILYLLVPSKFISFCGGDFERFALAVKFSSPEAYSCGNQAQAQRI